MRRRAKTESAFWSRSGECIHLVRVGRVELHRNPGAREAVASDHEAQVEEELLAPAGLVVMLLETMGWQALGDGPRGRVQAPP